MTLEVKKGMLLQYHPDHYGKYYPDCPVVPFYLGYKSMNSASALLAVTWEQKLKQETKKFVLFVGKVVRVQHPRISLPRAGCEYALCFISDPYSNGETIDGWVQPGWLETLTESPTYEHEAKKYAMEAVGRQRAKAKAMEQARNFININKMP